MMTLAQIRRAEAQQRKHEREAAKRQRSLEKALKEQAKLTKLEQARLEVEEYEATIELLLSVHKDQSAHLDWTALASYLPPPPPARNSQHELIAILRKGDAERIRQARDLDERNHKQRVTAAESSVPEHLRLRDLARRVLTGSTHAYAEAVVEFLSLEEISNLGSEASVKVYSRKLVSCHLKVNGRSAIPTEVKTLTASGNVSVKPMPKARFHDIYQDYACGCILRVARELFAILPVETVLVTAVLDQINPNTGQLEELPVLSVAMPRATLEQLDFSRLDPSDSMANFLHRGDVVASKKSGNFTAIIPLGPSDLPQRESGSTDITTIGAEVRVMRHEINSMLKSTSPAKV